MGPGSHHIAHHIATRAEGGNEGVVQGADGVAQVVLDDTVKLDALTGGDAQGAVAVAGGNVIVSQILLGGEFAAWQLAAHHELVFLAGLARIPIHLLIRAVKFDQDFAGLTEKGVRTFQVLRQRAAQAVTFEFDLLYVEV